MNQHRDNWVDNVFTGESDILGGHDETAWRTQLLWTPTDKFSASFMYQKRELDGSSATLFRANVLNPGNNSLNSNYTRDQVAYDSSGNNTALLDGKNATLKLEWEIGDYTLTSITAYWENSVFARADVDGGGVDSTSTATVPAGLTSFNSPFAVNLVANIFGPALTYPGEIFLNIDNAGLAEAEQLSQEFRIASNFDGSFNFQTGFYLFSDQITQQDGAGISASPLDADFAGGPASVQDNDAWAVFAQADYDLSDLLTLTVGLRYSDDEKVVAPIRNINVPLRTELSDDNFSWNLALSYKVTDNSQIYTRAGTGFRAPSLSTRGAASLGNRLSTSTSETISSFEVGYKGQLLNDTLRFDANVYYYDLDDMQITALGGNANDITLLNADGGLGYGAEFSVEYFVTDNLYLNTGFAYTYTEIKDDTAGVGVCRFCTVTDPTFTRGGNTFAAIDGNPFPHAPEWNFNISLSYTYPLANENELFFSTDWRVKGETTYFLYESIDFTSDVQFEGDIRGGYRDDVRNFEVAAFSRNVTDEDNVLGGLDFAANTAYTNEPRTWGVEFSFHF